MTKVVTIDGMFLGAPLAAPDISQWNTENVKSMVGFVNEEKMNSHYIDIGPNFIAIGFVN
ncbi:unnamed protein product, partial [Amoebophrya sp. A25]|eukprot:GSA25T00022397001.1